MPPKHESKRRIAPAGVTLAAASGLETCCLIHAAAFAIVLEQHRLTLDTRLATRGWHRKRERKGIWSLGTTNAAEPLTRIRMRALCARAWGDTETQIW